MASHDRPSITELYEREKARADLYAAEARGLELTLAAAESALAAARRECEVREAAHRYCLYMFKREWLTDAANRNIFAAQIFKILDAALAAPVAGEEEKR